MLGQAFLEPALGLLPAHSSCGKVQNGKGDWMRRVENKPVRCGGVLIPEAYTEKPPMIPSTRRLILPGVSGTQNHRQAAGGEGEVRSAPETTP